MASATDVSLFVRKASGLVRSWSVFDAFIYATFSINLITLGLFIFSYCYYFEGDLATAVVVGGAFTIFEVVVYASLISVMPRAGGDYVWQSRILGRGIGFILTVTGWWFILWLWVPLYGQILNYEVLSPLFAIAGAKDIAINFISDPVFGMIGSLIVCALVFVYIAVGMKWYARIQKFCFWGGVVGLAGVFLLLLFGNQAAFAANLNSIVPGMYGTEPGVDLVAKTMDLGAAAGTAAAPLGDLSKFWPSFALIPMMVFFNLWPNWGSTLYGEVRGASDYKRNFWGMASAVIVTALGAVIFFALIAKTIGWDFYNNANGAFWNYTWGYTTDAPAFPFWPYPALFAAFMVNSPIIQFLIILLMSLWWFGWSGTVFLSSTRVIFAAAFDRMLPEWVSKVTKNSQTPVNALLLMVVPGAIIGALYAFNIFNFQTLVLDATLVIAVTFLGSAVAAAVLPWRQKDMFEGSPVAKIKMPTWLGWLMMLVYAAGGVYLIYTSGTYAVTVLGGLGGIGADALTWVVVVILALLTVANAVMLIWLAYTVGTKVLGGDAMPLTTLAALVFVLFLDWLLIEWLWDPHVAPFDFPYYAIGWSNVTSMVFMFANYAVAAAIFFGFNAYRRRQGIDIDKVYKEIPVE